MKKSKLIYLLKSLDAVQWLDFERFIHSPYFFNAKRNPQVLQLFDHLKQLHPFDKPQLLEKERIFSTVFPDQTFSPSRLSKLMMRLLKVLRLYIAYDQRDIRKDAYEQDFELLCYFKDRSEGASFKSLAERLEGSQQKEQKRGQEYYWQQWQMAQAKVEFRSQYDQHKGDLNLQQAIRSLDHWYLMTRLEYSCAYLNQYSSDRSLPTEQLWDLEQSLAMMLDPEKEKEAPLVHIYQLILSLSQQYDSVRFNHFRDLLSEYAHRIPFPQLQVLQALHRSFIVRRINQGEEAAKTQLFQLYKSHLKAGFLYYEGALMSANFRHLVVMGLRMEDYEWVRQLIEDHRDKIRGTRMAEQVYAFNKADYFFALKQYEQALDWLPDDLDDLYQKIDARRLELKIYFELDHVLLDARIDTFKMLISRLSRKILPPVPRKGNLNFVNMLRQILHPNTLHNAKRIEKLLAKTRAKKIVAEKRWLLSKLQALEKAAQRKVLSN
ncbi:MAG: hypothetical protein AAFP19_23120 [Bacteroidota bacterium]